jgi:CubicO group peptidase (beta-lactamase class C family)
MCALKSRLDSPRNQIGPQHGQTAFLALPDAPNALRRQMLAAMGVAASGAAVGWPGSVLATGASAVAAPGVTPATFVESHGLAAALVRKALESTETSSISMALISGKGLVWAQALGTMGDPAQTPVTPHTLYCIGSCSKLLATVTALQLADRGLVQLDAPVVHYLPAFSMRSPEYRDITVRMLINHQSGLPGTDYSNGFTTLPFPGYSAQVLRTLAGSRLKHQPGEMSVYCNDGFTMVEQLVRAVTGMAYPDYVQRNILDPLGMGNSRYAVQLFPDGSFAPGRDPANNTFLECVNVFASGGLFTTPTDMARFAGLFLNRGRVDSTTLLSEQAIDAMARLQAVNEPLRPVPVGWGFGLGWDDVHQGAFAAKGIRAWRKNGGTLVYGSDFYVLPDHGLAFMITGTSTSYAPDSIAEQVLYAALREQDHSIEPPRKITSVASSPASPWSVAANTFSGIYANYQSSYKLAPLADPDAVQVYKWQNDQWEDHAIWRRRSDGLFAGPDAPLTGFGLALAGDQRYLTLHTVAGAGFYAIDLAFAQELLPLGPIPKAWQPRIDKTWVVVNERYDSLALAGAGPALKLFTVPDLPGYIGVNAGPSATDNQLLVAEEPDAARMCLKIPYNMGRDLNDLLAETHNGQEHLRFGRMLFKPLDAFTELMPGASQQATINNHGHAVGFRTVQPARLELENALAAFVFDANFEPAFPDQFRSARDGAVSADAVVGTKHKPAQLALPEGGFALVYGEPGATVSVRTKAEAS